MAPIHATEVPPAARRLQPDAYTVAFVATIEEYELTETEAKPMHATQSPPMAVTLHPEAYRVAFTATMDELKPAL